MKQYLRCKDRENNKQQAALSSASSTLQSTVEQSRMFVGQPFRHACTIDVTIDVKLMQ